MAIELPNGKISRTLPEQVGFNSEKIAEIIKWINDSDFIDKVIDLSDPSGVLTNEQYSIAELNPSYIIYGGKVFIKSLEDTDNIDFIKAGTDMSGSTSIVASIERVRVVKATKGYTYAVVQLFESYNKTQLDTLLAAKANLSGATFTGPVIAQTLSQSQANWEKDLSGITLSNLPAGCTIQNVFSKMQEINNVLWLTINIKIVNNTESATSSFNGAYYGITDIPEAIGNRLYDFEGNKVSDDVDSSKLLLSDIFLTGNYPSISNRQIREFFMYHYEKDKISVGLNNIPAISANSAIYICLRTPLLLL